MEMPPSTECQICFSPFSPTQRPKLLECRHTCCSACLHQMVLNHKEVRCPWCRHVTHLSGLSVFQLPDDPEALSAIALAHAPVFIQLPNSSHYLLPLTADEHPYRYGYKNPRGASQPEHLTAGEEEEEEEEVVGGCDGTMKSLAWTRFCAILLVAIILLFLLAIVLHNMSCVSKRFSIISCG